MSNARGRIAPLPDGGLWFETSGEGEPLVLIHGFALDSTMWDKQFMQFSSTYKVIRYDLRGFGRSSRPVGVYSHVDDLLHLLQHLGIASASFLGLSLGANVALNLALARPDSVKALIAASPGLAGHVWTQERPPEAALAHARRHGVEPARDFWFKHELFARSRAIPEACAALRAAVQRYDGWHWENQNPMRPFELTAARLGHIKTPTLVLSGDRDIQGYRDIAKIVAEGIPGADSSCFQTAGHMLNLDDPQRFNTEVVSFLKKQRIA